MEELDSKTDGSSADVVARNIDAMKGIFPDVFTENGIDFDALRESLGEYIDDKPERFGFTWNGKSRARRIAQKPSTGTLRPCPEESVNWETSESLFLEGDNLEVLKLLQKSYHRRVKMIYIDPPYNTGSQFIYPDRFEDNLATYMRYTGQVDGEGLRLSANAETSGRYHTNWLNMMYPRLRLARNLLREDGALFISIDDVELANLRKMCDELMGEENFLAVLVWEKVHTRKNSARYFSVSHDYIVVYAKSKEYWDRHLIPRDNTDAYSNPDNDPKGPWKLDPIYANNPYDADYTLTKPNGVVIKRPAGRYWRFSESTLQAKIAAGAIVWGEGASHPMAKRYLSEVQDGLVPVTLLSRSFAGDNLLANDELKKLFGADKIFDYPKPSLLIRRLAQTTMGPDDIPLDFFAGSCTAAQSVMEMNREDEGRRRFIMVQLPEPCSPDSEAAKAGLATIAEVGKERIRRVMKAAGVSMNGSGDLDCGFKVFKLDSSNIVAWDGNADDLERALFEAVGSVKSDRNEQDVLYELLLKYGLDD